MKALRLKLAILLLLPALIGFGTSVSAADIELTLAYLPFKGTLYVDGTEKFAEKVKKATSGKVKLLLNDSLIKGPQLFQSVRDNRVPMSNILLPYYSAADPIFGMAQLPGLMDNLDEFKKVFYKMWREDMNNYIAKKYNARVLTWGLFAPQNLISIKPIKSVADFKGKKIRVHNIETGTLVSALGAKPTPMPGGEVFTSLQKGIIDGVFTSSAWAYGQSFYTVAKNVSLWPISTILAYPIVVNQDEWKKLPKDVQDQIAAAGAELEKEAFDGYVANTVELPKKWAGKGAIYYVAPESEVKKLFQAKHIAPVYEAFYGRAKKAGFDGEVYVQKAEKVLGKKLKLN